MSMEASFMLVTSFHASDLLPCRWSPSMLATSFHASDLLPCWQPPSALTIVWWKTSHQVNVIRDVSCCGEYCSEYWEQNYLRVILFHWDSSSSSSSFIRLGLSAVIRAWIWSWWTESFQLISGERLGTVMSELWLLDEDVVDRAWIWGSDDELWMWEWWAVTTDDDDDGRWWQVVTTDNDECKNDRQQQPMMMNKTAACSVGR